MANPPIETQAPQRLKKSYQEYLDFANESQIAEWVEGEVIYYMPPLYQHQSVVSFLDRLLGLFIEFFDLGALVVAPFEVKLWPDGPSREPDIFFVSYKNRAKLTDKRFEGGPDLIIEVISPSSVTEDRVRKFTEYEKAGVKEYWIIDPRPHQQQADFYVLDDNQLFQAAPLDEGGFFYSTTLPNFRFRLNWLWQEELPNPQLALAEVMLSIEDLSDEAKRTYQSMYNLLSKA